MQAFLRILCTVVLVTVQTNPASQAGILEDSPQLGAIPMLEDGTPVRLRISQTVSSADAHVDDRISFEVLEEVKVGDLLVIPKGGVAWGTVTEAQSKRRMARGGKLEIVMDSVRLADGQKAALRAVRSAKGGGHTGAMTAGIVAAGLLFWPAAPFFLFMHGKDILIPKGAEVPTFINGNFKLEAIRFKGDAPAVVAATQMVETTKTGSSIVAILSTPAGADIYLDKNFVGNTPTSTNIAPGKHSISVKKDGFWEWQREITLSGGNVNLTADLVQVLDVPKNAPARATVATAMVENSSRPVQAKINGSTPPGRIGVYTNSAQSGGATITALAPEGPAATAGLKVGDTILKLDANVVNGEDFESRISSYKSGEKVVVTYMRGSWRSLVLVVVGTDATL